MKRESRILSASTPECPILIETRLLRRLGERESAVPYRRAFECPETFIEPPFSQLLTSAFPSRMTWEGQPTPAVFFFSSFLLAYLPTVLSRSTHSLAHYTKQFFRCFALIKCTAVFISLKTAQRPTPPCRRRSATQPTVQHGENHLGFSSSLQKAFFIS